MLVSGGKVIAIDSIKKNNTNKSTLSGDGVWTDLGVNTDNIATTEKLKETSANLHKEITATSSYLDQKKQDNLVFKYNKYNDAISSINGSALDAGNKVTVTGDQYIDVSKEVNNDQITYTVVGSAINNRLEGLSGGVNTNKNNIQTLSSNLDNLSGKVNTNTQKIEELSGKTITEIEGDSCLAVSSTTAEDGTIKYKLSVTAEPTDTTLVGENGIYAKRTHNEGEWAIGLSSDFLSANALNNLSGNWQNTYNTVCSYSADWQKVNDKVDTTSFNQYKTEVNQEFVNTSSWANGAFYPLNDNPKGYLTEHQSLEGLMSANLLDIKDENIVSYNKIPFSANLVAGSGIIIDGNTISTSGLVSSSVFIDSATYITNNITILSADVSSISANLEEKYDVSSFAIVSGDFYTNDNPSGFINSGYVTKELEKYYLKTETSAASALKDEFGNVYDILDILQDNSAHNTVTSTNDFIKVEKDGTEYQLTFNSAALQASGNYLSANALDFLKEPSANWNSVYDTVKSNSADWNEVSAKLDTSSFKEVSGKFALSADVNTRLEDTSAWANATFQPIGDYLSASNKFLSANALDNLSGNWESTYNTVTTNSAKWNEVSSLSSKLDISSFEDRTKDWDVTEYTGIEPIYVNDHQISADLSNYYNKQEVYTQEQTDEKIAEALANYGGYVTAGSAEGGYPNVDDPSTKYIYLVKMDTTKKDNYYEWIYSDNGETSAWECIGETTMDLTPYLEKTEAAELYQPKGNYVTSSTDVIHDNGAYVLTNDNGTVKWSGLDVSELGKKYVVTSTNNTVYVGSAQNGNTITYNLSADIPTIPGISGYNYVSAYYDENKDKYIVGLENHNVTYFAGNTSVSTATTLTNNIIPFNDGIKENITVTDGVFTIPDGVEKVTFCINETVEDNIVMNNGTAAHTFQLNKISLRCGGSVLLTTQDYYNNEVGYNELTLTYTVDTRNRDSREYTITYEGTPLINDGVVKVNVSIKEDVIALSESTGGEGKTYYGRTGNKVIVDNSSNEIYLDTMPELSGVAPIYTSATSNYNLVGLNFDPDQFAVSGEGLHSTLQIRVITSGGIIDQEAFEKMADVINGRMTETIPFGALNGIGTCAGAKQYAYLFRPTMDYDMTSATVAYMFGGNHDAGERVSVAVYSTATNTNNLIWRSDWPELNLGAGGEHTMTAHASSPTGSIHPDQLYYACVRIDKEGGGGSWNNVLGMPINNTTDVGSLKPWLGYSFTQGDNLVFPNDMDFNSKGSMGSFGGIKPYIGFRTQSNE